ncbi:MAG: AAA family ATPase [Patescibacteria group bacterium]|nr:AAA family ATPase [Patescibacteria group bacterium]
MPIVTIAPATRQGMKLLISLFGMSETGKTLSALKLAAGIEPDPRKRGLLDSEGGERGRAYVDLIPGGYMYGAITPPFTPERYREALKDFIEAGVTTLVIDSISHIWTAEGGVLEMVENAPEKNDMAKWAKPKRRLNKFTNAMLTCGLHLIVCARGKQPYVEAVGDNGRKTYVLGPVVPVQEKSLRFDLTIIAHMLGDGRFSIAKEDGGKCPGSLRPVFAAGDVMNEEMGRRLIAWIGGQDVKTGRERGLIMDARDAADRGVAAYQEFWNSLTREEKATLQPHHANLKSVAIAADAEVARQKQEGTHEADMPFDSGSAMPGGIALRGGDGEAEGIEV